MTAVTPLPSVPSSGIGNPPAATFPPGVAAGADFFDLARVILAASPETDTAGALDEALAAGHVELRRIETEINASQTVAVDPLASADDAASAEARAVSLGSALRRARSAVGQLEGRLTAYQRRAAEMRAEAERRAILHRFEAAQSAVASRYPKIAEELGALLGELDAARIAALRARIKVDQMPTFGLGMGMAGETAVSVRLPKIDGHGQHWPEMRR